MTTPFPARYCDGATLRSVEITLEFQTDGALRTTGPGVDRTLAPGSFIDSGRLGRLPRFLRLRSGGVIELPDSEELDHWLATHRTARPLAALLHRLESHAPFAAVATLFLVAVVGLGFWCGLPRLAERAARAIPADIEQKAGAAGYNVFARSFPRSALSVPERQWVRDALEPLLKVRPPHVPINLVFLAMDAPNAFALPGGTIVVTDKLVYLVHSSDEMSAVLTHELAHVERRHGLQSILRNSTALLIVSTLTGDLSTLSTFSGTLPFLLLQYGYAREFEAEADAFAIDLLRAAHIDPVNLATVLESLEKSRPHGGADFSYLSTHPSTPERIRKIDPANTRHAPAGDAAKPSSVVAAKSSPAQPQPAVATGDTAPVSLRRSPPTYPASLRAAGIEGDVVLEFIVDTEGRVRDPHVLRSSHPGFEPAALACVKDWTFRPARKNGRAVNTRMQQPITFSLEDEIAAPLDPSALSSGGKTPAPAPKH